MPYDIKNYKGASVASVLEGTVNTQTSLNLVGQNYKNYGQLIAENFVHIIENFARDIAPTNPSVGQLWYKPVDGHLYILDQDANSKTKWKSLATLEIRPTDPTADGYTPREGDFWFNSASDKGILNIRYRDDETGALKWGQLSVPVSADATLLFHTVMDDTGDGSTPPKGHGTIKFVVDNKVLAIFSSDETPWKPLGASDGLALSVSSGGTIVTYDVEDHPDFTPLHNSFPLIQAGLTLSVPYDPDIVSGGSLIQGYEYQVKFPNPGPGGVIAEGYAVIKLISSSAGKVDSITITNPGSGYTSTIIGIWNALAPDNQLPVGQTGSALTVPKLGAVLGVEGEYEDKITSVTVGLDNDPTGFVLGGSGYYTPPIKPVLSGSVRIGAERTNYIDLRNLQAGFGRKIVDLKIIDGGSDYPSTAIITIPAPKGEEGIQATASITAVTGGVITGVQIDLQGDGYTYAPSVSVTGGNSDARFLAVLGDNRLILDPNAISGDKIHGGNISDFESSAIADNTNWQRNDPGIDGLIIEDGYTANSTGVHNDDEALWTGENVTGTAGSYVMPVTSDSLALTRRRAGYVEVAFEREQTIGNSSTAVTADGAFRVLGGAHVQKNLQINGNLTVTGSVYAGGGTSSLETNNLVIEDNLIELNKSQSDAGGLFAGVSGLFIDRGITNTIQQPFATILWDDLDDAFGDPDFFKLGSFLGTSETTTPQDPPITADTVSNFVLGRLDALVLMAQNGLKADVISDYRTHEAVPTSRDVGGHLTTYNGWDQDITSVTYPYTAKITQGVASADIVENGNDLILVDTDERIIRGEFHFYRDAYPTDGRDSLIDDAPNTISDGGTATGKARGSSSSSSNMLVIRDNGAIATTPNVGYFKGSGGPGSVYSSPGTSPSVTSDGANITGAHKSDVLTNTTFLEDPAWWVDNGDGVVSALREGRALGWQTPRVHVHSTAGVPATGALVMPQVSLTGTLSGATVLASGKHYTGSPYCAVVGEARDTTTASGSTSSASGGHITVATAGGKVSGASTSAAGSNYRSAKPFKEVNSTKFNGILCADPTQTNNSAGIGGLADSPGVTDNTQKYVGLYPIMDGHNTSTDDIFPYDGSGMTIGYQQGHFVDAYIKNIRVENPWDAREDLTILNRATHANGTDAKANINIRADCTGNSGWATVNIQANGGNSTTSGRGSKIYMESKSYGNDATNSKAFVEIVSIAEGNALSRTDIVASTDGTGTAGTQESKLYLTAKDSDTLAGSTSWPYGQRREITTGGTGGPFEDTTRADDGNEVHVQATNMVVVERVDSTGRTQNLPTGTASTMTDWLTRFEVDAKDTRLNGHVHLGDGTLVDPGTTDLWDRSVYFNANVSSHVFPGKDSDDTNATTGGAGWDLGGTDSETRISDHHANLTATGATDRRWRTLYVRNISAGSNSSTGTITGDWSLTGGSTLQATYTADLAERYEADEVLEPGTVVAIGGDNEVTATTTENDENVFGVVSTEPAFIMNSKAGTNETHPMVAMTGRCPCKVVGRINKGDRLVSSSTTGRARKADLTNDSVYAILGRAIEAHDFDGEGTIEIAVTRN